MANKTDKLIVSEINNKLFVIPYYQRGYRWTGKNVKQLLNDLLLFANAENDDTEYDGFDYDAPENAGEKEYDMEHDRKNFGNHNIYNDNGKASMDKLRSLEMNE